MILLVILNLIWLNHRHKFKTSDSKFCHNNLLPYNCCTLFCQSYPNSNILHTFSNQYTHIRQCTDLSINMRINLSPLINNNSLNTNINLYTVFNTDMDLNMHMKINIGQTSINLCQMITSLLLSRFNIIANIFLNTWQYQQYKYFQYKHYRYKHPQFKHSW